MKHIPRSTIEAKACEVLQEARAMELPVPVDRVAERLGLSVTSATLGDDVSGVLVVSDGRGTIGYNANQSPVRQRFTIAHELGHFVLHYAENRLFIDKQYTAVFKRDQESKTGEQRLERQANHFAAALLMPRILIEQELRLVIFDLADEEILGALAKRFAVSTQAMSLRLAHLDLLEGH